MRWGSDAKWRWVLVWVLLMTARFGWAASCTAAFSNPSGINANLPASTQPNLSSISWQNNAWPPDGTTLSSGTYYYAGTTLFGHYQLNIAAGAHVTIYVNGSLTLTDHSQLNGSGNASQLVLVVNRNVSISNHSTVNGLVYATNAISLSDHSQVTGALASAGSISQNNHSTVTYDPTAVANANLTGLCTQCNQHGLAGTYFNNYSSSQPFPTGTPDLARFDSTVNFDWGSGSPDPSINSDRFAVQWEGSVEAPESGWYYFMTYTDDGVRLWVNDLTTPIIDHWRDQSATARWSGRIYLQKGQRYPVRMQYYENGGVASAALYWVTPSSYPRASVIPNQNLYGCPPATPPSLASAVASCGNHSQLTVSFNQSSITQPLDPSTAANPANYQVTDTSSGTNYSVTSAALDASGYNVTLQLATSLPVAGTYQLTVSNLIDTNGLSISPNPSRTSFLVAGSGLVVHYWNNETLSGNSVTAQTVTDIQNNWGRGSPVPGVVNADSFSARWDGYITAPSTGQYVFSMGTDDGGRLYLTDMTTPIISAWHLQSLTFHNSAPITLTAGHTYQLRMDMYEHTGFADAYLNWQTPGSTSFVPVPGSALSPCPGSGLDHFQVSLAGTASVCAPTAVTITAEDVNGNTINGYTGTVALSTSSSHGNWSIGGATGTLSPSPDTNDDGKADYSFGTGDNGQAVLNLANGHADQLTVTATDTSTGATGTSGVVRFSRDALVIKSIDPLGDDFIAGRDQQIEAQVWQQDPTNASQCSLLSAYNGSIGLKAWITRSARDPGGAAPAIGGQSLPNSQPTANNLSLNFSAGKADFAWQTSDVGQYSLNLLDDSSGQILDSSGRPIPLLGTGPQWTVRPFGFALSVAGNPRAGTASGAGFMAAGQPFSVKVTAVQYQAADDSNGDGQPDGFYLSGGTPDKDPTNNANLSDNPPTPSFGNSGSGVALSGYLVAGPTSAADPGLQGALSVTGFSGGTGSATVNYPEVGSIEIAAEGGGSYLGRAVNIGGRSGYVGRFFPDHFGVAVTSNGSYQPQCGSFAYIGRDFGYQSLPQLKITPYAHAASGTPPVTTNYRGGWQKLSASDVILTYPTRDQSQMGTDGTTLMSLTSTPALSGTLTALGAGEMNWSPGTDQFRYDKNSNALVGPFTSNLPIPVAQVRDSDGVSAATLPTLTPTGIQMRYGRLAIDNAYGPETQDLIVPFRAEYYDGSNFVTNIDENCWSYDTSTVSLSPSTLSTVKSVSATLSQGQSPSGSELRLAAPGAGNQGEINLTWPVPVWLQYDWNGDGTLDNPSALATFGVYRGNDRIIYWKEVGQ